MLSLLDQTDHDDCAFCPPGPNKRSVLEWDTDDEDDDGKENDTIGYMTTCYHVVCTKHYKKLLQQQKDNMIGPNMTVCQICDDRNKPEVFKLLRSAYKDFQDERERIRNVSTHPIHHIDHN